MAYQIVHAIEGRIRVRIPQLASDPEYAGKFQSLIEARKSITNVRINPQAQSIVITYKAKAISLEAMQAQIQEAIEQLSPPTPPPDPVQSPAADVLIEPVTPVTSEDDPWADQSIAPQATSVAIDLSDSEPLPPEPPKSEVAIEDTTPLPTDRPLPEQISTEDDRQTLPEPTVKAALEETESIAEPMDEPHLESATVAEPTDEPRIESATVAQPTDEPRIESATVAEPMDEPRIESATVAEPMDEPHLESATELAAVGETQNGSKAQHKAKRSGRSTSQRQAGKSHKR